MAYERFDPDRYRPIRHNYRGPRAPAVRPVRSVSTKPHCAQRPEGDEFVCPTRGCFLRWDHDEERPPCPLGLID